MTDDIEEIREKLKGRNKIIQSSPGLSCGLTLGNLALTGTPDIGLFGGCYYLLVGDSASGKTFLALQTLAEACYNKAFDGYRLVYDAPERGARMSFRKFFGKLADRIQDKKTSNTIEQFYFNLDDELNTGPCIYVLDSMDALTSKAEQSKFDERKEADRKNKKVTGSYSDGKAKQNSSDLRVAVSRLEENKSILIVISQTRDNIGFGSQFNPQTRSGGRSLTFYATCECWLSIREKIKRTVRGKSREVGTVLKIKVKKNRETGRLPPVELHHYPDFGFDDMGSSIAYLIDEGHWREDKGIIIAPEFNFKGRVESLAEKITETGGEKALKGLVTLVWKEIEEACQLNREPRYK